LKRSAKQWLIPTCQAHRDLDSFPVPYLLLFKCNLKSKSNMAGVHAPSQALPRAVCCIYIKTFRKSFISISYAGLRGLSKKSMARVCKKFIQHVFESRMLTRTL